MANYYVLLSTHIEKERDTFYAKKQLRDRRLSIGWGDINPINKSQPEIKRIIEDFYPEYKGTVNPDIGAKSLTLFANLMPSDIVFVRGLAKILDVVIVNGTAYFDRTGHYDNEYYLKIPFVPLFGDKQISIKTADIPDEIYNEVVYEGGRSMVIRQIAEDTARGLLKTILVHN